MSKHSSNNILAFKRSSDEVRESVKLNSAIGVNFSNIGDSTSCNRQFKSPFGVNICIETKSLLFAPSKCS